MTVQLATAPAISPAMVLTTVAPRLSPQLVVRQPVYITRFTVGWVYIIHFSQPLGNLSNPRAQARHYAGFALDPLARFQEHCTGQGAKITRAAVQRGITLTLVGCHEAPQMTERMLKRQIKNTPRLCPLCCAQNGWRCRSLPIAVPQPLQDDTDFPPIPPGRDRPDWYEIAWLRRCEWVTRFDQGNTDDCDIPF